MNSLKLLCCVLIFFCSLAHPAETPATGAQTEFLDLFSSNNSPGEGSLTYADETEKETITFGIDSGIYGVGLVIKGKWLPENYKKDFSKSYIIQLALGTLKSKLDNKIPQFGAATLIHSEVPKEPTAYPIQERGKKTRSNSPQSIIYFTSPKTLMSQSEQQKLQGTFYHKSGGITVTPVGETEQIAVQTDTSKVFFKKQKMKFDFQMVLSTPFNGLEKKLTGTIIFPVFTPTGKAAEALALRLSGALEQGKSPLPNPTEPNRTISTKPGIGAPK